jgi:hypothetical protein
MFILLPLAIVPPHSTSVLHNSLHTLLSTSSGRSSNIRQRMQDPSLSRIRHSFRCFSVRPSYPVLIPLPYLFFLLPSTSRFSLRKPLFPLLRRHIVQLLLSIPKQKSCPRRRRIVDNLSRVLILGDSRFTLPQHSHKGCGEIITNTSCGAESSGLRMGQCA